MSPRTRHAAGARHGQPRRNAGFGRIRVWAEVLQTVGPEFESLGRLP
jgi:hypothetical protein